MECDPFPKNAVPFGGLQMRKFQHPAAGHRGDQVTVKIGNDERKGTIILMIHKLNDYLDDYVAPFMKNKTRKGTNKPTFRNDMAIAATGDGFEGKQVGTMLPDNLYVVKLTDTGEKAIVWEGFSALQSNPQYADEKLALQGYLFRIDKPKSHPHGLNSGYGNARDLVGQMIFCINTKTPDSTNLLQKLASFPPIQSFPIAPPILPKKM